MAYGALQVPCTILIGRVRRPAIFLCGLVLLWGTASACMGCVRTFGQALACRMLLALAESPFFCAVTLLLSRHYTKSEVGARIGCLFIGELGSNAVVGLCVLVRAIALTPVASPPRSWATWTAIEGMPPGAGCAPARLDVRLIDADSGSSAQRRWLSLRLSSPSCPDATRASIARHAG